MINYISIGQYFPGTSVVHRLDPRAKIIALFLYIVALFFARDYFSNLIAIIVAFSMVLLSCIPIRAIFRSLKPIIFFIVFSAIIHLFFTPGTEIWRWGVVKITREGMDQAIFITIRLILLIGVSSLLTFTTTPIALTDGMERLMNPFKRLGVPAHELAMMMSIALRFIPTLLEETEKIMKAQMSRGVNFRTGGLMKRARAIIPLLVPLFIGAFRRAEDLALAMEARGYRGGEGRTRMKVLRMTGIDTVCLIIFITFFLLMGYYRWFI